MSKAEIYGLVGGTLASVLPTIHVENIIATIIFAVVGSTVSFFISKGWNWVINKFK